MSYILDALRRADSERERGQVPGIHALSMPLALDKAPAAPRAARWVWALAATGTLLAGVLAWVLASREAPMRAPAQALSPATPAPVRPGAADPAAVPAVLPKAFAPEDASARPASTTAAPATTGTTLPRGAGAPATPATPAAPAASAPAAVGASPQAREAAPPAQIPRTAGAGRAAASGPGASAAIGTEPRIHALHELPEEVRRAIPPLVVNGSVYSKNPEDRFLIVNGQIVHESEPVAPDVMLEKIGPRAAVLNTHGYRFEISY
jgi:general secretion pathway protein B